MPQLTPRQRLGIEGELFVVSALDCPVCKTKLAHVLLPRNTPCVDVKCSSCEVESQVKAITLKSRHAIPLTVLGGSWKSKKKHLEEHGFVPYFLVFFSIKGVVSVFYLPVEGQSIEIFKVRNPLTSNAKSPGWVGYELKPRTWTEKLICIWGEDFSTMQI